LTWKVYSGGNRFVLLDTAGIRKRPETLVEELAIKRSLRAIEEADVVLLVVDPFQVGDRELKLANHAMEKGKPVLLVITKWDLVTKEEAPRVRRELREKLAHLEHLPRVYTSAFTKQNLDKIFSEAVRLHELNHTRVPTAELNRWLGVWTAKVQLPNFKGKPLKILYATQPEVAPAHLRLLRQPPRVRYPGL
jgi:GTP-binding protein